MQGSVQIGRILIEPMAREVNGVPTVIEQDTTTSDGRITAPARVRRIYRRAILETEGLDLDMSELADCAGPQSCRRPADDRGVFPVVNRNDGTSRFGRCFANSVEIARIQNERLFAEDAPPAIQRGQDGFRVQRWRRADIDEIQGRVFP